MRQALILCGGKAQRLRPYSYGLPKACMLFLNLPLLSLGWLYLEQFNTSHFLLNSHLFPESLEKTVRFLSQPPQKTRIFFEGEPLGGAGTLYKLKKELQKTKEFIYLNGDSLFFPSHKNQLQLFEEDFLKTKAEASFFSIPFPLSLKNKNLGALWCDQNHNVRFIGTEKEFRNQKTSQKLSAFHFSGLALFKSSLLDSLKSNDFNLFKDFINPLLEKSKIKVFSDNSAVILEAGDKISYLESTKFCLENLFSKDSYGPSLSASKNFEKWNKEVKKTLKKCFARFDPEDQFVGFQNGGVWSKKLGYPLLAPKSVQGLGNLKLKGPAVVGEGSRFFGQSILQNSILGSQTAWQGQLNQGFILKYPSLVSSKKVMKKVFSFKTL